MSDYIARLTYASMSHFSRRLMDTAEPPRMQDSKFEREVRKQSQEIAPVPIATESERPREYHSREDIQYQMDEIGRILEAQKKKED